MKNTIQIFYKKHGSKIENFFWLMLEKIILLLIEFFVVALVARSLGVESYGTYAFIISFVAILSPFAIFGLSGILVRYCIDGKGYSESEILSTAIILRFLISLIMILIVSIYLTFNDYDKIISAYLLGLTLSELLRPLNSVSSWFESKLKSKWAAKSKIISVFFVASIKLFGVYFEKDWDFFVIAQGVEVVLNSLLLLMFFTKVSCVDLSYNFVKIELVKKFIKDGFPLFLSSIGAIIYLKADILMLNWLLSEVEVGLYSAAARLSELAYILPIIFMSTIFPSLMKSRDEVGFERQSKNILGVLFYSGLFIALILYLGSFHFVSVLYGEEYLDSALILSVHCFSLPFVFIRAYLSKWIIVSEVYRFSLITQLSGAVSNILGNLVLVPSFGAVGAAYSTIISILFASILPLLLFKKTRKVAIWLLLSPFYILNIFSERK